MIKIAILAPILHLEDFSSLGDIDMALTHLVLKNQLYSSYFVKQILKNNYVILDNSVFELGRPMKDKHIIKAVKIIRASEVVAPDFFGKGQKTVAYCKSFIKVLKTNKMFDEFKIQAVAHGKDLKDWVECYNTLASMDNVDVIGVPFGIMFNVPWAKKFSTRTKQMAENRFKLIKYLVENCIINKEKEHHCMGVSDGKELYELNKLGVIRSNDSSSAVAHGMHGIVYTMDGLPCEKIKSKLNFYAKIPEERFKDIYYNIKVLKAFASGVEKFK